jgi:hypothetical protein
MIKVDYELRVQGTVRVDENASDAEIAEIVKEHATVVVVDRTIACEIEMENENDD